MKMIQVNEAEYISEAEHTANIIEGRAESNYVGVTRPVSVRIPLHLSVQIQTLAHKSGKTKNAMMIRLFTVGIEEVQKHLSDETNKEMAKITAEIYQQEMAESAGE
jgi:hypothetical protein